MITRKQERFISSHHLPTFEQALDTNEEVIIVTLFSTLKQTRYTEEQLNVIATGLISLHKINVIWNPQDDTGVELFCNQVSLWGPSLTLAVLKFFLLHIADKEDVELSYFKLTF